MPRLQSFLYLLASFIIISLCFRSEGLADGLVPVHEQDSPSVPWQQAGGQQDPLWGHGVDPTTVEKPEGVDSPNDETTTWVKGKYGPPARLTSDPSDRGWWVNAQGEVKSSFFYKRSTQCQPCRFMVMQFNDRMSSLLWKKADIERQRRNKDTALKELRSEMQQNRPRGLSDLDFAGQMAQRISEVSTAYDAMVSANQREAEQMEQDMQALAAQIAECEKQCAPETPKTGLTLGENGGWIPATAGGLNQDLVLPIRWEGPYRTECDPCKEIARSLNSIPSNMWHYLEDIYNNKLRLLSLEASVNYQNLFADGGNPPVDAAASAQRIRQENADLQRRLALKVLEFHRLKEQLAACEKEKCKKVGMLIDGFGTGGQYALVSTELEHTVSISGTNPFDAREIERIPSMVGNTEITSVPISVAPPPVAVVTPPPATGGSSSSGGSSSGGVVTTPLAVTTSGSVSFAHIVGTSSCPQTSGTISVTSNNGNALTVSGVSVSGDLSSRLTTAVTGNGNPTVNIFTFFNCSSSTNGTFTGTLTGTATDAVTGESASFSASGSGTVTGP